MFFSIVYLVTAESARGANLDPNQLLQRLKHEAIPAWRSMAAKLNHVHVDYKLIETTDLRTTAPLNRIKRVFIDRDDARFLITETIDATGQSCIYARNATYEFALNRTGSAPWMIEWQSDCRTGDTPVSSGSDYLSGMLALPWSISATPLEKLVTDPRFSIASASAAEDRTIRVEFTVRPATQEADALQGLASGSLVLDPSQYWAIRRYDAHYATKMSTGATLNYRAGLAPELRDLNFTLNFSPTKSSKFVIDSLHYDWAPASLSGPTLSSFGLPEFRDRRSTTTSPLVFVNVGLICIVVSLMIYKRVRSKRMY